MQPTSIMAVVCARTPRFRRPRANTITGQHPRDILFALMVTKFIQREEHTTTCMGLCQVKVPELAIFSVTVSEVGFC